MRIISYDTGRVTWLFPTEEFGPLGSGDGRTIIEQIAEKYDFLHPPQNPTRDEIDKSGLKFSAGKIYVGNETFNITEFIAYNDGLVCASPTTEPASEFLRDLMEFLITEFRFREPITPIKKVSLSTIIVEFDQSINSMLSDQQEVAKIVSGHLNASEQTSFETRLSRIDFTQDRGPFEKLLPKWTLEARANVLLSQNRYYSSAAVATKRHLEMLAQIEALFTKPRAD